MTVKGHEKKLNSTKLIGEWRVSGRQKKLEKVQFGIAFCCGLKNFEKLKKIATMQIILYSLHLVGFFHCGVHSFYCLCKN